MRDILFESSKASALANSDFELGDERLMRSLVEQLAYAPGSGDNVLFNDVASKLSREPLAGKARSWQTASPNISLSPSEVTELLGSACVQSLATSVGSDTTDVVKKIAKWLPAIIQEVTVFGELPEKRKDIQNQLGTVMRRLPTW